MINGSLRKSALCLSLAAVLGGCQIGGSTVSEREGYFTWVDEQGRVRYSPITGAEQKDLNRESEEVVEEVVTEEAPVEEAAAAEEITAEQTEEVAGEEESKTLLSGDEGEGEGDDTVPEKY